MAVFRTETLHVPIQNRQPLFSGAATDQFTHPRHLPHHSAVCVSHLPVALSPSSEAGVIDRAASASVTQRNAVRCSSNAAAGNSAASGQWRVSVAPSNQAATCHRNPHWGKQR